MAQFRPQLHIMDYKGKTEIRTYETYVKLKKAIPKLIWKDSDADGMFVVRSRRGQWGEWFERWKSDGFNTRTGLDRVKIVKQGWS